MKVKFKKESLTVINEILTVQLELDLDYDIPLKGFLSLPFADHSNAKIAHQLILRQLARKETYE